MFSKMSRLIAVGAVITATGGVWAGVASAATTSRATSGTEHLYLMTTEPSAAKSELIATGVFTTNGTDVAGSTVDTAHVTGGTFKITHKSGFKIVKEMLNSKTCFAVFEATTKFTLGGGTGAYKGLSGSGKATINITEITAKKKGKCNPNVNPVANEQTITGTATVKL
jgi:hypothetical protein